jgi:uncharacterized protein YggE
MKKRSLAIAAIALLSLVALASPLSRVQAQEATPSTGETTSTVYVDGVGNVVTTPDTASVVIGVNIIEKTLGAAQEKASSQMAAVIEALKAAGIEEKDIQTTNFSVSILQDYDTNGNPTTIEGFQVSNQVTVTVRDLAKLGDLLDQVVANGANSIYGISFYVNDPSAAESQARKLAVENAKQKADELAAAAGMTVGKVLSIAETSSYYPMPSGYARAEAAAMDASTPIQTGSTTISISVTVTYELLP